MKRYRLTLCCALATSTIFSNAAFAAAFQLYELGTPIVGTADVGQASLAQDASISYFNPAGMTLLDSSQFMLGAQALISYVNFSKDTSNTISGDNGSNAGAIVPGFDVFYVYSYSPKLKFGLNVVAPYGGELNYTDGWVGRYSAQQAFFVAVDINPSIGYQINHWLSVGAGATFEYLTLQQTTAFPLVSDIDGQIKISVADFAPGFNLGVMLTPCTSTKIGLSYRSQIVHHLHGNSTFLRIDNQPDTTTKMVMPSNAILSVAQDFSSHFTLLGELGWADWSSMRNSVLNVANLSADTILKWNNTYRFGLGAQFKFNPCFLLQLGASYDSSPTTASRRLPVLPMDRQVRLGAGIMYALIKNVTLGASYEYINFGRASIHNISSVGVLSGSYSRNYANTLQLSVNIAI